MGRVTIEERETRDMRVEREAGSVANGRDTSSDAVLVDRVAILEQRLATLEQWLNEVAGDLLDRTGDDGLSGRILAS